MTSWDKLNQIKFQLFVSKTIQSEMAKITAALELDREEWVTSKVLSERMPMLTADFLKKYGKILPRERESYMKKMDRRRPPDLCTLSKRLVGS